MYVRDGCRFLLRLSPGLRDWLAAATLVSDCPSVPAIYSQMAWVSPHGTVEAGECVFVVASGGLDGLVPPPRCLCSGAASSAHVFFGVTRSCIL